MNIADFLPKQDPRAKTGQWKNGGTMVSVISDDRLFLIKLAVDTYNDPEIFTSPVVLFMNPPNREPIPYLQEALHCTRLDKDLSEFWDLVRQIEKTINLLKP